MSANELAEFGSLLLTAPTILLALFVVWNYGPRAREAVQNMVNNWGPKFLGNQVKVRPVTDTDFLVAGIVVGFIGAAFDNIYWGIAWTSAFLDLPTESFWFSNGVWANIPFRQLSGIAAAIFHLWPVRNNKHGNNRYFNALAYVTIIAGVLLVVHKLLF